MLRVARLFLAGRRLVHLLVLLVHQVAEPLEGLVDVDVRDRPVVGQELRVADHARAQLVVEFHGLVVGGGKRRRLVPDEHGLLLLHEVGRDVRVEDALGGVQTGDPLIVEEIRVAGRAAVLDERREEIVVAGVEAAVDVGEDRGRRALDVLVGRARLHPRVLHRRDRRRVRRRVPRVGRRRRLEVLRGLHQVREVGLDGIVHPLGDLRLVVDPAVAARARLIRRRGRRVVGPAGDEGEEEHRREQASGTSDHGSGGFLGGGW